MTTAQMIVSREVRRFMTATSQTQTDIARALGVSQTQVSQRLAGNVRWSFDDLDALIDAGVPLALSAYGTDTEAVGA
ncbi:helix-turn-helix domain-containing protein [Schaalia vaccimaxillae]|uniref:helix-turn-helix domain-containing protein n=1 Tax=Schaalia vaccimaxillae TaxID=183916 RepID=UPI0003B4B124|nr:helix-turn-helix transcriptional regulator [Schaalia vaccimaxillae]